MKKGVSRFMGILLLGVTLVGFMLLSGGKNGMLQYIDQPSLLLIVIIFLSMMLLSNSLGDYLLGIKIVSGNPEYTTNELKAAINAMDLAIIVVYLSAAIGFLLGMIAMLGTISDMQIIQKGTAITLLVVFYALIINLIQYSIRTKLRKELIYRG